MPTFPYIMYKLVFNKSKNEYFIFCAITYSHC